MDKIVKLGSGKFLGSICDAKLQRNNHFPSVLKRFKNYLSTIAKLRQCEPKMYRNSQLQKEAHDSLLRLFDSRLHHLKQSTAGFESSLENYACYNLRRKIFQH